MAYKWGVTNHLLSGMILQVYTHLKFNSSPLKWCLEDDPFLLASWNPKIGPFLMCFLFFRAIFRFYVNFQWCINSFSRWWQLKYFLFSPEPWGNDPFWLIFFRWVETTNSFSNGRLTFVEKKTGRFSTWLAAPFGPCAGRSRFGKWRRFTPSKINMVVDDIFHVPFFLGGSQGNFGVTDLFGFQFLFIILHTQSLKSGDTPPLIPGQWLLIEPFFVTSKGAHIKIWSSFLLAS